MNFCENAQVFGISTVVACIIAVACAPANECVPDVGSISAAVGAL